jgi:hypothetical protein
MNYDENIAMYLTTRTNGATARCVERPGALSANVFIDPEGDAQLLSAFLANIGVIRPGDDLSAVPRGRMRTPPMDGDGLILIISDKGDGKFGISVWQLLPPGENPLMYGSPLMPE